MKRTRPSQSKQIDWQQVRRRLAQAIQATEEVLRLSPERARAVMEERARELARVPPTVAPEAARFEVVVFSLANERYGIETRHVREVLPLVDFTPLPGTPEFLVGVSNLRGQVLPIVDVRKVFGIVVRGLRDLSRVVVLGEERAEFGILADAVHEVKAIPAEQVQEPPQTVAGVAREYLRGVTGDLLVLLNGAVLLQDKRLIVDQGEEGQAGE